MNWKNFIIEKKQYGLLKNNKLRKFNVAFGIDANYVPPTGVMIQSILDNNPNLNICAYIFLNSIGEDDSVRIEQMVQENNRLCITVYYVDDKAFSSIPIGKGWSSAMFNRLIMPRILEDYVDKIMYMDADTICVGSIEELLDIDFNGNIALVMKDTGKDITQHKLEINIVDRDYFNSGFMYIDLNAWNASSISEKSLKLLAERTYGFPDQDILNILIGDKSKFISKKFNSFCELRGYIDEVNDETVLIHFVGHVKPWHKWVYNDNNKNWKYFKNKSPWKDYEYMPRNYQENRLMGEWCRRNGKYIEAIKWYWKYLVDRQKEKR